MISSIVVTRPLSADELAAHRGKRSARQLTSVEFAQLFSLVAGWPFHVWRQRQCERKYCQCRQETIVKLIARMHELFPRWRDVAIDYRWHGLVCMTRKMTPSIGQFAEDKSTFFAFGYHGNGVNTATWSGKKVADWLATSSLESTLRPRRCPQLCRECLFDFHCRHFGLHTLRVRSLCDDWQRDLR